MGVTLGEAALLVKELYALHQLFCQRQNLVFGSENMVNGNATRNLLEVQELGILPSLLTLINRSSELHTMQRRAGWGPLRAASASSGL